MAGFLSCLDHSPPSAWRLGRFLRALRLHSLAIFYLLATGWSLATAAASDARQLPELRFEAPEVLAPQVERLEGFDAKDLMPILDLLGLDSPGPAIRILLAPEGSPAARAAPSWAVAYALGGASQVVLIPSRVPSYPDHTLETVLRHEIAHVLIARAAGHRAVPRWFNEGLAIYGSRDWGFEDRARLTMATVRRGGVALADLDQRFQGGQHSAASAYALSAAFVRYLLDQHGPFVASRIFEGLSDGQSFEEAFRRSVGHSLVAEEARFWRHLDIWSKWVPLLSSSTTLWMLITLLALWAFKRRRERDEEMREAWDEEERQRLERAPTQDWVH